MAHQRRSESRGHGLRGGAGRRGLAAVVWLSLLVAGCGDSTGPDRPGSGFGIGKNTSGSSSATLVGTWRSVTVIQVPGDVQTWTTTWVFDSSGSCHQTVVVESQAEGFPRTTERACTWTASDSQVVISFVNGGTLTFDFSFAGLSPDHLVLDGFEYQRLA